MHARVTILSTPGSACGCRYYGLDVPKMEARIQELKYDAVTLNYQMLLLRLQKGNPMRLPVNRSHMDPAAAMMFMKTSAKAKSVHRLSIGTSAADLKPDGGSMPAGMGSKAVAQNLLSKGKIRVDRGDPMPLSKEHRSNSVGVGTSGAITSLDQIDDPGSESLAIRGRREGYGSHSEAINVVGTKPTKSRSIFGSLGSLFGSRESLTQPRKVKGLFNVRTTSTKTPDAVKAEVLRVLSEAEVG